MLLPWHHLSAALDRAGIGGIDHHRRFDLGHQHPVEGIDVLQLFAFGGLQADVDDVRAVLHLPARDFGGFLPFLFGDHVLEEARADHVGAFADDQRTEALFGFHQFDAGIVGAVRRRIHPRRLTLGHLGDGTNVGGRGPAASADDVQPALVHEFSQLRGERLGRFQVLVVFVGQTGIRIAGDPAWRPSAPACGCDRSSGRDRSRS